MKKEIMYIANDGKRFKTEEECQEYEDNERRKRTAAIQKTMLELDEKIWKKFYPDDKDDKEDSKPELNTAYLWLKSDIVHILTDEAFDTEEVENEITAMIKATEYAEEILNRYVSITSIRAEVRIRKDYLTALKKVKNGSDLASDIRYSLGKRDICQLAKLHKANKCREKIEDLLTCCNFHYESGMFAKREYTEFLSISESS